MGQTILPPLPPNACLLRPCRSESETLGVLVWALLQCTVCIDCGTLLEAFLFVFHFFHLFIFRFFIFFSFFPAFHSPFFSFFSFFSLFHFFFPHCTCRQSAASFRSTPRQVRAITQHSSKCLCYCPGEYTQLHMLPSSAVTRRGCIRGNICPLFRRCLQQRIAHVQQSQSGKLRRRKEAEEGELCM